MTSNKGNRESRRNLIIITVMQLNNDFWKDKLNVKKYSCYACL